MNDYIEWFSNGDGKFVTSTFVRGRRIAFYGLPVAISQHGTKVEMSPVFPCMGPLLKLVKSNPECNEFTWTGKEWKAGPK